MCVCVCVCVYIYIYMYFFILQMASNRIKELKIICQYLVFRIVEVLSNVFFWVVYHGSGEKMPPIQNLLLLDTATAIAHKIRTRKVSLWLKALFIVKYTSVEKLSVIVKPED